MTTGGGETGAALEPLKVEEPCLECDDHAWLCLCTLADNSVVSGDYYCWDGPEFEVDSECEKVCVFQTLFGVSGDAIPVGCAVAEPVACEDWDPKAHVRYDGQDQVYSLSSSLVAGLDRDPTPLWTCDRTLAVGLMTGGFEIADSRAGDLLYELGLRNGDVVHAINGHALQTFADAGAAYATLWLGDRPGRFVVEVQRGAERLELSYVIEP